MFKKSSKFALLVLVFLSVTTSVQALTDQEYLDKGQTLIGQGNALQLAGIRLKESASAQKALALNSEMTTIRVEVSGFDKQGQRVSGSLMLSQGDVGWQELSSNLKTGLAAYSKKLAE